MCGERGGITPPTVILFGVSAPTVIIAWPSYAVYTARARPRRGSFNGCVNTPRRHAISRGPTTLSPVNVYIYIRKYDGKYIRVSYCAGVLPPQHRWLF